MSGTLQKHIDETAAVLVLAGEIDAPPADAGALLAPDAVVAAAKETQKLIDSVRRSNPLLAARLEGSDGGAALSIDEKAAARAEVLGDFGTLYFAAGKRELDDGAKRLLDDAAHRAGDFNPHTTALVLGGWARDAAAATNLAGAARDYLQGKGLALAIVPLARGTTPPGGRDRVQVQLVRPRE